MKRSELVKLPEYFDRYILQCDDVSISTAIQSSIEEIDRFSLEMWEQLGPLSYAPGKWSVKDILQHVIDTERIFSYRALAFARGEQHALPSYDENQYAISAKANSRSMESLLTELRATHHSLAALYESFSPTMLQCEGQGFKGTYSVADIGFILPGHQRWHFRVIEERYLSLLTTA